MRAKLETMTGTGSAMTRTPESEQMPPKIFPITVTGTISPYLKGEKIWIFAGLFSFKTPYFYLLLITNVMPRNLTHSGRK